MDLTSNKGSSQQTEFGVYSEVGKLRKVLVHRPDLSLQRLTPANHDDLLFDDVLWVEHAQREHDAFVARMQEHGVEVFYLENLLAETLEASEQARDYIVRRVVTELTVGISVVDEVRALLEFYGLRPSVKAILRRRGLGVFATRPPLVGLDAVREEELWVDCRELLPG